MSKKSKKEEEKEDIIDDLVVTEDTVFKKSNKDLTLGGFLSNSKKVKQFSKLNEVAFRIDYMALFKKDPKSHPCIQSEFKWEVAFQKLIGVDFNKLKI